MKNYIDNLLGKGLYVFSDPGGAKPCLSFVGLNKISNYLIVSDRKYSFYKDFGLNVKILKEIDIENFISEYKPDYIFSSTSYTSNIEKIAIRYARDLNIPCITYIDHSTNLIERFSLGEKVYLPSIILVSDIIVKTLILKNPIFSSCEIFFVNNPYLTYLSNWKPKIDRNTYLNRLDIPVTNKIALIALDPLSNLGESNDFGFDEIDGIKEIDSLINSIDYNYSFICKPHPNQNLNLINYNKSKKIIFVSAQEEVNHLIYYSDVIIGFFSNILIEANALNKRVIRFQPFGFKYDPFNHLHFGNIATKKTIEKYL